MATKTIDKEIVEREKRFWDAMQTLDADAAVAMTDQQCIVAGAQGVSEITPEIMGQLMKGANWKLNRYTMDEKDMHMRLIGDSVAIVGYKVTEEIECDGEKITLEANDTSVWVRHGLEWLCALHTESPAGDPFGRDKKK